MTVASILTQVGEVITFVLGLFSDLFTAITSNPWLLYSILIGFASVAIGLVIRVIKRVRKV